MRIQFPRPRFLRDTRGSVSVEAVLIAPLLVWGMVSTYVFYDGFRTKSRVQIAANTVVDVLSRQTDTITPQFVNDLNNIFDVLATSRGSTSIRVTSVAQTSTGAAPVIAWSHGTRGIPPAQALTDLTGAVPPILTGEAAVVVETFGTWTPPFSLLGMENIVGLNTQVTSRPRFRAVAAFRGHDPCIRPYRHGMDRPRQRL
jgi:Flp pilus assembly protein TadG